MNQCARKLSLGKHGDAFCVRVAAAPERGWPHDGPHRFEFSLDDDEVESINAGSSVGKTEP